MDLIISKNGYSDYKRKTIDDKEEKTEILPKEKTETPFKSYL
jgi:hypothetical protein